MSGLSLVESAKMLWLSGSVCGLVVTLVVDCVCVVKDGIGSEVGLTRETSILGDDEVGECTDENMLGRIVGRRTKAYMLPRTKRASRVK